MSLYLIEIGFGVTLTRAKTWERARDIYLDQTPGVKHISKEDISLEKGNIRQVKSIGKEGIIASSCKSFK